MMSCHGYHFKVLWMCPESGLIEGVRFLVGNWSGSNLRVVLAFRDVHHTQTKGAVDGLGIRRVRKRKRRRGEVQVLRREEYEGLELNAKVELIR